MHREKMNTKGLQTSLYPNFFWSSNYLAKKVVFFSFNIFSALQTSYCETAHEKEKEEKKGK